MSPHSRGKSNQRARSAEDLLETTEPDEQVSAQAQMKKAKSLEEYLDTCDTEDSNSVSASMTDNSKKQKNFMDKCINKMKSFIVANKKTADSK